jgi:hypothetical protein
MRSLLPDYYCALGSPGKAVSALYNSPVLLATWLNLASLVGPLPVLLATNLHLKSLYRDIFKKNYTFSRSQTDSSCAVQLICSVSFSNWILESIQPLHLFYTESETEPCPVELSTWPHHLNMDHKSLNPWVKLFTMTIYNFPQRIYRKKQVLTKFLVQTPALITQPWLPLVVSYPRHLSRKSRIVNWRVSISLL